jgi:predicted transcriptional regulator
LRHRSKSEIIADILQTLANGGATQTRIMYGVFLSFSEATDHLHYLTERNLVSFDGTRKRYVITSKGMELLDAFEGTANLVEIAPFDRVGASF